MHRRLQGYYTDPNLKQAYSDACATLSLSVMIGCRRQARLQYVEPSKHGLHCALRQDTPRGQI
ncbi:hypothetical protein BV20DRAFT_974519 [Pilatotrama ljubarskyi]|nr:hypothetical protein BV20DRAFT_974519 [Pilatotrama ljubarskyi]